MSTALVHPQSGPPGAGVQPAFDEALRRAMADYLEMPGLRLTEAQAARLWSFDIALCRAVLTTLVNAKFLARTRDAHHVRQ